MDDSEDAPIRKPIFWLHTKIKSPPFTLAGRIEAGGLLGNIQDGMALHMPISRPMPSIGPRCHELRVRDERHNWRIIYRIDPAAILVVEVFPKKTVKTPKSVIAHCKARLAKFDAAQKG